ncbi:MAG: hypothetical protein FVQ80_10490 [Planctomycetes bacterium]|nr:hypothetical protein [Planctomycetota bacterium]
MNLILASIQYGGYISIIKLVIFLIMFMPSLMLITWVYTDASTVGTKEKFWTAIVFAAIAAASLLWLILPLFIVGLAIYLIAVAVTTLAYVKHRNSMVLEYDRILTPEHIKGLFSSDRAEKLDALKSFLFITANKNDVPMPEPKTPEFYGYKAAYDIFHDAIWRRASNILYTPTHQNYNVIYVIDGVPIKQPSVEKEHLKNFINFVRQLADLDVKERRKPQKGRFSLIHQENQIDWEIITAGSTMGEQLKLTRKTYEGLSKLSDLELMPEQLKQLAELQNQKQGIFIISGPKKSGVTTTFYALMKEHDAFLNSIETLELDITADVPNVDQKAFSLTDTGTTTFAKKLFGIVRMGPDIVGVAGCNDSESAKIAAKAANDGKLIYITLEADNVIQALDKWRKLVADENLAIDTLVGITNQRLLRKLCDECKQGYTPNSEILRKFNLPAEKAKVLYREGKVIYDKHNKPITCENCQGTGFIERTAVFEIITLDDELREQIKSKPAADVNSAFKRAKMRYLQEHAMKKVIAGTTAINEMVRVFARKKTRPARKKPKQQ